MERALIPDRDWLSETITAWQTNHRANDLLLSALDAEGLACTLSRHGGRTVARQFAHMHTNRVRQLEARARDLADGLYKFAAKEEPDAVTLAQHLEESTARVQTFLRDCAAGKPKRRCFRRGVVPFLAYMLVHEAHHRGNMLLTLKQCGRNPDKDVRYGIWDWDRL